MEVHTLVYYPLVWEPVAAAAGAVGDMVVAGVDRTVAVVVVVEEGSKGQIERSLLDMVLVTHFHG